MYIDIYKFEVACAKKKWTPEQAIKEAGLQDPDKVLEEIYHDWQINTANAGKLADVLKVKVEAITRRNENFWSK